MIKFKSLNGRLLFAFASLSIIVCLFFIRLTALLIEITENNTYQSVLMAEVETIQLQNSTDAGLPQSDAPHITIYNSQSTEAKEFVLSAKRELTGGFRTSDGQRYIVLPFDFQDGQNYIAILNISLVTANAELSIFKSLVLYSITVSTIVLCLLSSWYLAKWLSTPIRKLTFDISNQQSNQSTALYGLEREDEIGKLANALKQSYQKIQTLLKREQNFTRDVSHELRTPITLIKNTIALNPDKQLDVEATKVISQASNELEQTVEVLLALARQENLRFNALKALPIIEKTVLNIYNSYPDLVFDVKINVDPKLEVTGNQYLISLLCQNLVNNGFYHSNSDGMRIYSELNQLVFENPVLGSNERPYYQGLGHGQYLVNRIAQEMKWQINIEQNESVYRVTVSTV